MFLLSTDNGDVRPLPVVGVAFPYVVVDIISAGVSVHEIIFLFLGILVTPPWGTLWFFVVVLG